jgi:hypothetical protein
VAVQVDLALKKVKSRAVYGMVARLAPVALQPWKPPGVYQRSTAAVFPPPAAAGTFTIGTLQIFLSPRISLFFIETFFDRRKIYCSATKIYQYLLKILRMHTSN